jgi:glycerol uptake facilitator-like aquaporin
MSDGQQLQSSELIHRPGIITHNLVICFYEFLGTAMLVLGYNFTAAGLAVGFNLFVGILMAAKVSGGMFNPAVTFAVYTAQGKLFKESMLVGSIIISQIVGGFFGVIYAHFCLGTPAFLCPYDQMQGCVLFDGYGKVFLLEFWCTFFFCQCIICQIDNRTEESKDGILKAAAIAFTLLAMINTAGAISGGCFNPAFGLVQTIY